MADDATLMGLALEQAAAAADRGDPGFGAVMALELARLLGPRAIHLEDLRADYGHQILIEGFDTTRA